MLRTRFVLIAVTIFASIWLAACGSVSNDSSGGSEAKKSTHKQVDANVAKLLAFDESGKKPTKEYKIAFLAECTQNAYCKTRLEGIEAAAEKYGFTFKTFDANFNPSTQLKLAQEATSEGGWDGYLFGPAASEPGCSIYERILKPEEKPVVTIDLPMCGDSDYTPGLAATVTMQSQRYFDEILSHDFAQCKGKCKAVTFSGFTGSDLFNFWTKASEYAQEQHPNVEVIQNYPAEFNAQKGRQDMQDALEANPDINLVVSHDGEMTKGITAAIKSAGLIPGKDIQVYSTGGAQLEVEAIETGEFNGANILDPYDEGYYGAVALIMALEGEPIDGYINEADLPNITEGPGTIFLTPANVSKWTGAWGK